MPVVFWSVGRKHWEEDVLFCIPFCFIHVDKICEPSLLRLPQPPVTVPESSSRPFAGFALLYWCPSAGPSTPAVWGEKSCLSCPAGIALRHAAQGAVRAHSWLVATILSPGPLRSLLADLLCSWSAPSVCWCQDLFLPSCRACYLHMVKSTRFFFANFSSQFFQVPQTIQRSFNSKTFPFFIFFMQLRY